MNAESNAILTLIIHSPQKRSRNNSFCETIAALICRNAADKYRVSTKRWLKFSRGPKPPPHKGSVGS